MKKALALLLAIIVCLSLTGIPAIAEEFVAVILDGQLLDFDVPPQIINDRTLVPMRVIFEALGASVKWDNDTKTVTADFLTHYGPYGEFIDGSNGLFAKQITLSINSTNMPISYAFPDDFGVVDTIVLEVAPMLVNDRTLVPLRAVSEAFGATVDWDDVKNIVLIETHKGSVAE